MSLSGHYRYAVFDILQEATALKKVMDTPDELAYHKMVQTGQLEFHDYGTGFLNFELSTRPCARAPHAPEGGENLWFVRLRIATVDDGDMGAWTKPMIEAKARDLVERVAHDVMEDLISFPTLDELNAQLRPFGLYVMSRE